jgi:hypothetical protein
MSRPRTSMTPKVSCRFSTRSPMVASWVRRWAISATEVSGLAKAGETLGITVEAIARGRDGRFVSAGICWVVERSFA